MVKIGLEIHGYLLTKEKLFCKCLSVHGKKYTEPNINICPICTGQPGSKPLLPNEEAVKKLIQIALVLKCTINKSVFWQRKHYSWPDLPKGFQSTISGPYAIPNGVNGKFMGIRIRECHLEEDPAAWNPLTGEIDYNRSGAPLVEIVTEPDFKSSEEVIDWIKNLMAALGYVKAIDKQSGIKADVNVSIKGGKKIELKNINSTRKIKEAIEIEIARQKKDIPKEEQTRMYDENDRVTKLMRTKENAIDYRFIKEVDLPYLNVDLKLINDLKKQIPELPQERLKRIIKDYKIDKKTASILTKEIEIVDLFEKVCKKVGVKLALIWVLQEFLSVVNYNKMSVSDFNINPEHFIELLQAIKDNKITESKAQEILRKWVPDSFSPKDEINKNIKISKEELNKFIEQAIKENPKAVEDYKKGFKGAINFLVGSVMKNSNKRADFKLTKEMLEKKLK